MTQDFPSLFLPPDEHLRWSRSFGPLLSEVFSEVERATVSESRGDRVAELERFLQDAWNIPGVFVIAPERRALQTVLAGAGVEAGSHVIVSALSSSSVLAAIHELGAIADVVDIDAGTLTIDPRSVAAAVTDQTRAIFASHVCGLSPDMKSLLSLADDQQIVLIEDATQVVGRQRGGGRYAGRVAGSLGHFGYISCSWGTPMGTVRGIGLILANQRERCERIQGRLSGCSGVPKWADPYDVALLAREAKLLSSWNERRIQIAGRYYEALRALPCELPPAITSPYSLIMRSPGERRALVEAFLERGIATVPYAGLQQPRGSLFSQEQRHHAIQGDAFSVARSVLPRLLYLPSTPELTDSEVEACIAVVLHHFRRSRRFYLTPERSLVVNGEEGVVMCWSGDTHLGTQALDEDELNVLTALMEVYPQCCPYEAALAAFTKVSREHCTLLLRQAMEQGAFDACVRPLRAVLARCQKKIRALQMEVAAVLETGYIVVPLAAASGHRERRKLSSDCPPSSLPKSEQGGESD